MPEKSPTIAEVVARLRAEHRRLAREDFVFGSYRVRVESNSDILIAALQEYFRPFVFGWRRGDARTPPYPDATVLALDREPMQLDLEFRDWEREPGKKSLKERVADLSDGRAVVKVRTGMLFLVGQHVRVAVGPCHKNVNQVINSVVSRYLNHLVNKGWLLCHAAAVTAGDKGIALAGFSGGGKSTLALHLMARGMHFLSNDRVLVRRGMEYTLQAGVPKLPRINPGTALHNPHLVRILPSQRRAELESLAPEALWDLEEKYDVDLESHFPGIGFARRSEMTGLVILNWERGVREWAEMHEVQLSDRPDLLRAVMKGTGAFHRHPDGRFDSRRFEPEPREYLRHLAGVPVYEVTGGVDFERATDLCQGLVPGVGTSVS